MPSEQVLSDVRQGTSVNASIAVESACYSVLHDGRKREGGEEKVGVDVLAKRKNSKSSSRNKLIIGVSEDRVKSRLAITQHYRRHKQKYNSGCLLHTLRWAKQSRASTSPPASS